MGEVELRTHQWANQIFVWAVFFYNVHPFLNSLETLTPIDVIYVGNPICFFDDVRGDSLISLLASCIPNHEFDFFLSNLHPHHSKIDGSCGLWTKSMSRYFPFFLSAIMLMREVLPAPDYPNTTTLNCFSTLSSIHNKIDYHSRLLITSNQYQSATSLLYLPRLPQPSHWLLPLKLAHLQRDRVLQHVTSQLLEHTNHVGPFQRGNFIKFTV